MGLPAISVDCPNMICSSYKAFALEELVLYYVVQWLWEELVWGELTT